MSAPQPPADGSPRDDAGTPTDRGAEPTRTFEFHGEELDFDPYRFGRPEPQPTGWAPPAGAPSAGGRPPAPGERWTPGAGSGAPEVKPGDYWAGAGSHRGPFPPAGYVPPPSPGGDESARPAVDLGKPGTPSGPYDPPPGYPPAGGYPSPGYPPAGGYPSPGAYPPPVGPAPSQRGNGLAKAGLVLGILGLLLAVTSWPGLLLGLVGLGLAIPGLVKARRGAGSKGIALTGLVLSVAAVVVSSVVLVVVLQRIDFSCVERANGDVSQAQECIR